jgi:hypothetical protein
MIDPEVVVEANDTDTQAGRGGGPTDAAGAPGATQDEVDEMFAGDDADAGGPQTGKRKSELSDNSGDMDGAENTTGADIEDLAG